MLTFVSSSTLKLIKHIVIAIYKHDHNKVMIFCEAVQPDVIHSEPDFHRLIFCIARNAASEKYIFDSGGSLSYPELAKIFVDIRTEIMNIFTKNTD